MKRERERKRECVCVCMKERKNRKIGGDIKWQTDRKKRGEKYLEAKGKKERKVKDGMNERWEKK
jgi:hypothetical protein